MRTQTITSNPLAEHTAPKNRTLTDRQIKIDLRVAFFCVLFTSLCDLLHHDRGDLRCQSWYGDFFSFSRWPKLEKYGSWPDRQHICKWMVNLGVGWFTKKQYQGFYGFITGLEKVRWLMTDYLFTKNIKYWQVHGVMGKNLSY